MATNQPITPPVFRRRRAIFYIAGGVIVLALLTASPNVLAPWTNLNIEGLTDPEHARWDLALEGTVDVLTLGAVVGALWRPTSSVLLVQYLLAAGLLTAIVLIPFIGPMSLFTPALLLLLPVTYPYARQLVSLRSEDGPSTILLAVAVVAAGVLAPLAVHAITVQATLPRAPAPDFNVLATDAEHLLLLAVAGLLTATRRPGWKVLAVLVSATYTYLGITSILLPDQPNSWGTLGGTASLVGAAVFATAALIAAQGNDASTPRSRRLSVEQGA